MPEMETTEVSKQTLLRTLARVLTFLSALADRAIFAAMAEAGYRDQDHAEGWALALDGANYKPGAAPSTGSTIDPKVRNAAVELDGWDEPNFRRFHAALARLHPAQGRFVFEGLAPGQGAEAVASVAVFLDRVDALEASEARKATREADLKAIATLEKRGLTKAERARLRELVTLAKSAAAPLGAPVAASDSEAERMQKLLRLHAWYMDWSETARAVITRRDYLIRLGLAKRKKSGEEESEVE